MANKKKTNSKRKASNTKKKNANIKKKVSTSTKNKSNNTNKKNSVSTKKNVNKEKNVSSKKVDNKKDENNNIIIVERKVKVKNNKLIYLLLLIIFILLLIIGYLIFFRKCDECNYSLLDNNKVNEEEKINAEQEKKLKAEYDECLKITLKDNKGVKDLENELINKLNRESLSFAYYDLNTGYYVGNKDKVNYYAASTIKILEALYIYKQARSGVINLDDELTYSKGAVTYDGVTYKTGNKVSIRKLVELEVAISDNVAHLVLIDYIGFNNLKKFGNDIGATSTLVGSDKYGYINAYDGVIYLKNLNDFLSYDDEYSRELYEYFKKADQNYYKATDDEFIHKYGNHSYYYNDLGIVYGDKNYAIVLLSHYGKQDYERIYGELYEIVNEFNKKYVDYKHDYCYKEVYEK